MCCPLQEAVNDKVGLAARDNIGNVLSVSGNHTRAIESAMSVLLAINKEQQRNVFYPPSSGLGTVL